MNCYLFSWGTLLRVAETHQSILKYDVKKFFAIKEQ